MGLHLNFDLHLDASMSVADAEEKLRALHSHARTLPFASVSPFLPEASADSDDPRDPRTSLHRWASILADPLEGDEHTDRGDVDSAMGFLVYPGQRSETAWFGLMRRFDDSMQCTRWAWSTHCKTQYASLVSDAHLLACHTSLVALLDAAIATGLGVTVLDETFFWDTRDTARLLREVHRMNGIVAAFAGKLSDAMGEQHRIVAPIFAHRRFEQLEMGEER
jgi:hypothetical protein